METNKEDLIKFVTQELTKAEHPNPNGWTNKLDPNAYTMTDSGLLRFLINRALRSALGDLDNNGILCTIEIRTYLIDDGTEEEWKNYFIKKVLPCFVTHKLPL